MKCSWRMSGWAARTSLISMLVIALAVIGCSDPDGGDSNIQNNGAEADASDISDVQPDGSDGERPDCDSLQPERCELPWPSGHFLRPDEARASGYTLDFGLQTLPYIEEGSNAGSHASPGPYRRLDGYGVGTPLITLFPNVDTSEMATEREIGPSVEEDSPTVWLEVDEEGGVVERVPHFAELDLRTDDPDEQALFVRPAVILEENTRYVVAFRDLVDTAGEPIEPSPAFEALRDGQTDDDPELEARRERFDEIFAILEGEGVEREELTLAWDFHTASSDALHGPMLQMRRAGFEAVGERGPQLEIAETDIEEHSEEDHPHWWLEIEGTFTTPRFMKEESIAGHFGSVFNWAEGEQWVPEQNGEREEKFWLYVPHSARQGSPHGLIQYGHGLLGSGSQTGGGSHGEIANEYGFIFFGTNLAGMSEDDRDAAITAMGNIDAFVFIADRLHQGMLDWLLLARSMRERLPEHDEIEARGIEIDTDQLYYSGISQGGIFGGTYMALTSDISQGHLGVPGNNYSTLLRRSSNFAAFELVMDNSYPSPLSQSIILSLLEQLWEQTDSVSYLRHVSAEPFEDDEARDILLAPAKGDYQVEVFTNEIAARSDIDIALMEHYGRQVDLIDEQPYSHTGSGVVLYDFGNPWPEEGNLPPDDEQGDPHDKPRALESHNEQMIHFFRSGGEIIDVCDDEPCTVE